MDLAALVGVANEQSARTWVCGVRRACRICDKPLNEVWASPGASYDALQAKLRPVSLHTLETTVASLTSVARLVGLDETHAAEWSEIKKRVSREVRDLRESGQPFGRHATISWDEVTANNDRLRETARGSQDQLLSAFYTDLPPRRQADYHRIRILILESEPECDAESSATIRLSAGGAPHGTLRVTQFKTRDRMGPWTTTLPTALVEDLMLSLRAWPRDYVFCMSDGRPYSSVNSFTKAHNARLKAWFGRGANNNSLRHAMASRVLGDATLSLAERRRIAHDMGHSVLTNMTYAFTAAAMNERSNT